MANQKTSLKSLYETRYAKLLPYFKEKKTQAFTTLALTIITLSAFIVFAINPTLTTITQLRKQLDDSKFVKSRLEEKINNLAILQEKYGSIQNQLPYIFNAIPQQPDATILVGQLYAVAQKHTITVSRLQIFTVQLTNQKGNVSQFGSFTFSIQASGSYENLLAFMKELTNFQRLITIDAITIGKGADKNTNLQMVIKGRAYFKISL